MQVDSFPVVLTLEQAAEYLQVQVEDLRTELENKRIPGLKVAGEWRIKREALERLLDSVAKTDEQVIANVPSSADSERPKVVQSSAPASVPNLTAHLGEPVSATTTPPEADLSLKAAQSETPMAHVPPDVGEAAIEKHYAGEAAQPVGRQEEPVAKEAAIAYLPKSAPSQLLPQMVSPAVLTSPRPGHVQGRVFSYNPKGGFGYARLQDNRVVWLDSKCLIERLPSPFPGDLVEFELQHGRNGLVARSIKVVPKNERVPLPGPAQAIAIPTRADQQVKPPTLPAEPSRKVVSTPKVSVSPRGTPKARQLYEKAVLATTEGRNEEARRLFRQAIDAGAGTDVYSAFFKMETQKGGRIEDARRIIQQAIARFPYQANFYDMYGHMERRARNYQLADKIFREGLAHCPNHVQLQKGLWQTLVQIGTEASLREAVEIFKSLDRKGKLNKGDVLYLRFKALQRSPRANRAYEFFQAAGMRVGIVALRDLRPHFTDVVVETNNAELKESFGISGAILARCFHQSPSQIDIVNLSKFLRNLGAQNVLSLVDREVVISPSLAFIAVPNSDAVRDQIMSILGDNNEAIVPLDDAVFQSSEVPLKNLRDLLGQYLGLRDLYSSTLPVSGRRFFGRERLLLQLADEVQHGQFVGIYGLRKMGKTSLIYQLRDEKLRGEAIAYVDLQASATLTMKDCAPLYWELERDLYIRLRECNREAADLLRLGKVERFSSLPENGAQAGLFFAEDLRAFLDALSADKIHNIKHVVIVLDELERILPVTGQGGISGYVEFFALLRGLAQTERYRGLISSVVVAANAAISERGYWEGRENPVFALYKPVFLPPLSEAECVEMICSLGKGMSVYWDDAAIQAVYSEAGGHPFLTRSLCSRITRQYTTRPLKVQTDMVNDQIPYFIRDESDKLEQITELLRTNFPQEETLLEQIALGEAPADLPDESLRHLLGYRLIIANGTGYQVTLNLLCRWLRRRAGIKG